GAREMQTVSARLSHYAEDFGGPGQPQVVVAGAQPATRRPALVLAAGGQRRPDLTASDVLDPAVAEQHPSEPLLVRDRVTDVNGVVDPEAHRDQYHERAGEDRSVEAAGVSRPGGGRATLVL